MSAASGTSDASVRVCVLGELRVYRGGELLTLPQSRKARALLGYLVVTRRAQRRERLAKLFWDVADDARGALRWTLSRVRAAIDGQSGSLLVADRDEVRFEHEGVWTDRFRLPAASASLPELERAAAWFQGELLEGCDLPDFFEFSAWLSAEREEARRLRQRLLTSLSERLEDPERALVYARGRVQVDPLDEAAGTRLMKLLLKAGRRAEAEEHCESVARLLESVGQARAPWLASLRAELRVTGAQEPVSQRPSLPPVPAVEEAPFVGRARELSLLSSAARAEQPMVVIVSGDPGMGKSRLLTEASRRLGSVLSTRAYEADRNLPFLPWLPLLRALPGAAEDAELGPLLRAEPAPPGASREGLFRAVARALSTVRVLVFDDAQWLDDASLTLLHHVLRGRTGQPLLCLLGARRGELLDNPALVSLLRGARRDRFLTELSLEPLTESEVAALAVAAGARLPPERVARESEGSPLFALELSRWSPQPGHELPHTLRELVAERVERLPRPEQELLGWAAILGGQFEVELLGALSGLGAEQLLRSLEFLERHALLRAELGGYRLSHELLGRSLYLGVSEPRRKLMHRRVAELLAERDVGSTPAADVSRHAALAGDSQLAADFCLRAAHRCARLFANDEARAFAQRGLQHAAVLEESRRVPLEIELHRAAVMARRPSDVEPIVATLLELAGRALDLGHADEARSAYRLISHLRWEVGRFADAERANTQVENVGRAAGFAERARALSEAGHCLAVLERDWPRAEALLLEARALCRQASLELYVVSAGFGLLHRFRGEVAEAARLFTSARACARLEGDRWSEFDALAQLVELSYQSGDLAAAERDSLELVQLGARLPEGSEPAFSRGLSALVRYATEPSVGAELEQCFEELRLRDATHRLASLLIYAAELDLGRGQAKLAAERSRRAAALAEGLRRDSDVVVARALAVRAEASLQLESHRQLLSALREAPTLHLSARAQRALSELP